MFIVCILQITNKCPLCKLRFKFITVVQKQTMIHAEDREQENDNIDLTIDAIENEQKWSSIPCEICA